MQLEIPFYLGYDSKSFTVCYDAQAKINNFFTNWHCYLILMSYLSGIYLESWFLWLGGGLQKTLKKTEENKHFGYRTL